MPHHARRCALLAAALLSFALLASGCGPGWTVIKASGPPSAIKGATSFAVVADFGGLMVGKKSEAEYLSEKDEDAKKNFAGDKTEMHAEAVKAFKEESSGYSIVEASGSESGPDVVLVTVVYRSVEPGTYAGVYRAPTVVVARLVFSRGGSVVDEVEVTVSQEADIYHPSSGQRMRNCGEAIGEKLAAFVAAANK